ncbi:MAG: penicillin-binding protein 2 [Candidatus Berkelbacteria bacterium]|nr:penicillin-binding protein 2 [Candidatus Berkelbacteria bacterium]
MGRQTDRVDWEPVRRVLKIVWLPIGWIWARFRVSKIRSTDLGIFDPYVPLGSLKTLGADYESSVKDPAEGGVLESNVQSRRSFFLLKAVAFLIAAIFAFRLISLQITQGQENYRLAEGNRLKTNLISAPRGLIYDRNGVGLVQNAPSFSLILRPSELPKKKSDRQMYLDDLARLVLLDRAALETMVNSQANRDFITLLDGLNREQSLSLELKTHGWNALELIKQPIRLYGTVPSMGNLLGYIGKVDAEDLKKRPNLLPTSYVGKSGVESTYDEILQGIPGQEITEVDSLGRAIRSVGNKPSVSGNSLVLGLDASIQRVTATALQESIIKSGATNGAAVAIDVNTGDVLAMVSLPTFDNNLFSPTTDSAARQAVLQDPGSPLINRAISGQYPSGSTVKPFVATAGLATGVINANTKIDTSAGKIEVGQWTFHDWKTHGTSDVKQAIAESNNIFFYSVGGGFKQIGGLGAERLAAWLTKFGFGQVTGVDIPGEQDGLVPTPDWKKKTKKESWYIGDTYNLSIGQGDLLVTPLQLARATAAIANNGQLLTPRLVKSSFSPGTGQKDYPIRTTRDNLAPASALQVVREGMRQAVLSGSARSFATLPVEVAAKTGTAQFDKAKEKTHSWFTAFAPYNDPQIAVTVIVEGGGEGYVVAAPVAKNIIEAYFKLPLTPIQPLPSD